MDGEKCICHIGSESDLLCDREYAKSSWRDDDPSGKLIRQILGAVAEWEKCALVQKLRASRLRIRRSGGRCEGKKPYGHTPAEAKVVDAIVERRKTGLSYVTIADQLNAAGVKSRSGKVWHPTQVQRVLMRSKATR
jgi:hypothetical protein